MRIVQVRTTSDATDLIVRSGGQLFVWAKDYRCCRGQLITLQAELKRPKRRRYVAGEFRPFQMEGFTLFLATGTRMPDELVVEARGRRNRSRIRAYWNGCVYAPP